VVSFMLRTSNSTVEKSGTIICNCYEMAGHDPFIDLLKKINKSRPPEIELLSAISHA